MRYNTRRNYFFRVYFTLTRRRVLLDLRQVRYFQSNFFLGKGNPGTLLLSVSTVEQVSHTLWSLVSLSGFKLLLRIKCLYHSMIIKFSVIQTPLNNTSSIINRTVNMVLVNNFSNNKSGNTMEL